MLIKNRFIMITVLFLSLKWLKKGLPRAKSSLAPHGIVEGKIIFLRDLVISLPLTVQPSKGTQRCGLQHPHLQRGRQWYQLGLRSYSVQEKGSEHCKVLNVRSRYCHRDITISIPGIKSRWPGGTGDFLRQQYAIFQKCIVHRSSLLFAHWKF